MSFSIFTSEQVGAWLIYEGKKYREARGELTTESKDELDVILGGEHAMFKAAKRLYTNIGKNFVDMLVDRKFQEDTAKAINLVIGQVDKDEKFINCEADVLWLMCKMTSEAFFDSLSCHPSTRPYHMGRCVALGHFVDDLCFQLECDTTDYLSVQGIPLDVIQMITGLKT